MNIVAKIKGATAIAVPEGLHSPSDEVERFKAWFADRMKRAVQSGTILTEAYNVSPAVADYILKFYNKDNRTYRPSRGAKWGARIKNGGWRFCSQGFSFAPEPKLNNGQHRLNGIVLSGVTVKVLIAFNEDRDSFPVLDQADKRTGGNVLQIAGYENANAVAAACRLLACIERGKPTSGETIAAEDLVEFANARADLPLAATYGMRMSSFFGSSVAASVTACYLILKHSKRKDSDTVLDWFSARVKDADRIGARDPIAVFRTKMMKKIYTPSADFAAFRNANEKAAYECAGYIIAWNRHWARLSGMVDSWDCRDTDSSFPVPE